MDVARSVASGGRKGLERARRLRDGVAGFLVVEEDRSVSSGARSGRDGSLGTVDVERVFVLRDDFGFFVRGDRNGRVGGSRRRRPRRGETAVSSRDGARRPDDGLAGGFVDGAGSRVSVVARGGLESSDVSVEAVDVRGAGDVVTGVRPRRDWDRRHCRRRGPGGGGGPDPGGVLVRTAAGQGSVRGAGEDRSSGVDLDATGERLGTRPAGGRRRRPVRAGRRTRRGRPAGDGVEYGIADENGVFTEIGVGVSTRLADERDVGWDRGTDGESDAGSDATVLCDGRGFERSGRPTAPRWGDLVSDVENEGGAAVPARE